VFLINWFNQDGESLSAGKWHSNENTFPVCYCNNTEAQLVHLRTVRATKLETSKNLYVHKYYYSERLSSRIDYTNENTLLVFYSKNTEAELAWQDYLRTVRRATKLETSTARCRFIQTQKFK
jgi:hypothetical protein